LLPTSLKTIVILDLLFMLTSQERRNPPANHAGKWDIMSISAAIIRKALSTEAAEATILQAAATREQV
jgi:hypothetical protein